MEIPTIHNQIASNNRKTIILMLGFTVFIGLVTYILSISLGYEGPGALGFVGIFLIISGLINIVSYYWSDKIVISMSGAKLVEKKDEPELYRIVENLSIASGNPMPRVYVVEDQSTNAFATGRDPKHSAVAVTRGLLERLEKLELEGVIAHELSHIKNRDTLIMTVVVVLVGLVALLSDFFFRMLWWGGGRGGNRRGAAIFMILAVVAAILAPIVANLIKLAISRRREFQADASGALITRYPQGLANALVKISQDANTLRTANTATAHLYIENPFKGDKRKSWIVNLFSTHPPVEERVAALQAMKVL